MQELTKRQIAQLLANSIEGIYGEEAQRMADRYSKNNRTITSILLQFINDFYQKVAKDKEKEPVLAIAENIALYLLVFYRDLHKASPSEAENFLTGLIIDRQGVEGSKLIGQFQGLVEAAVAFKKIIPFNEYMPLWQQSQKLIHAYNEFLGGLFGYMIIGLKTILKQKCDPRKILYSSYGNKVSEFNSLTHGVFIELTNIAQPKLRNALAHGGVWHDRSNDNVYYNDRDKQYEMSLVNFVGLGYVGSYLCEVYIVVLSAALIIYYGHEEEKESLPSAVKEIFQLM